MPHGPRVCAADCEIVDGGARALPVYGIEPDAISRRIATHIAGFVSNGSVLQIGLGKVPQALAAALCDRRNLRLHSGMLSDGVILLDAAGALDPDWTHRTTALLGSDLFYEWAAQSGRIRMTGVDGIHDLRVLAALERLVAVNSALNVDLTGQCNLEVVDGLPISGPGGAPDFARAAALSHGGCSIVALPATIDSGQSRIVTALPEGAPISLGRADVDVVITEEGAADLRGKTAGQRAEALIAIAAPAARESLERGWRLRNRNWEKQT